MDDYGCFCFIQFILYVFDINVLIYDLNVLLNFQEYCVVILMMVFEELDKLKIGKYIIVVECCQVICLIDQVFGEVMFEQVEGGVLIQCGKNGFSGSLLIFMSKCVEFIIWLLEYFNDNKIINQLVELKSCYSGVCVVLVIKDINMCLKVCVCGVDVEDYYIDQLIDDVVLLLCGYYFFVGFFWDCVSKVEICQDYGCIWYCVQFIDNLLVVYINEFIVDEQGFVGWIKGIQQDELIIFDLYQELFLYQEVWGLWLCDVYQLLVLYVLFDLDIYLVNLFGVVGFGKIILVFVVVIEQIMVSKCYWCIIVICSVQGLDEDIGFLFGIEVEKMEFWFGVIIDNFEVLYMDDECIYGSVDYIFSKVLLQFKLLNYICGCSFQQSLIFIDECQNFMLYQMKIIIICVGSGLKVICLGNLVQIDMFYLFVISFGLIYFIECFKDFFYGVYVIL